MGYLYAPLSVPIRVGLLNRRHCRLPPLCGAFIHTSSARGPLAHNSSFVKYLMSLSGSVFYCCWDSRIRKRKCPLTKAATQRSFPGECACADQRDGVFRRQTSLLNSPHSFLIRVGALLHVSSTKARRVGGRSHSFALADLHLSGSGRRHPQFVVPSCTWLRRDVAVVNWPYAASSLIVGPRVPPALLPYTAQPCLASAVYVIWRMIHPIVTEKTVLAGDVFDEANSPQSSATPSIVLSTCKGCGGQAPNSCHALERPLSSVPPKKHGNRK